MCRKAEGEIYLSERGTKKHRNISNKDEVAQDVFDINYVKELNKPKLTKKCPNGCNEFGYNCAHEIFSEHYIFCPYCGYQLIDKD